jgi:G3E family GTPase
MTDTRLPVLVLTGFLGSGKTTLLNAWLRSPELADAAVIVNEFGEIGIDHALIAASSDNTIELSTGCLCCTVRGDLVDTLRELQVKRARGEVKRFDRVIIETTGLADPAPVIQALITFPVARLFRVARLVTAVDAVQGVATLAAHVEARKQVAVADDLVLTKTDLAPRDRAALAAALRALNPGARLHEAQFGSGVPLSALSVADIYDPATKGADVLAWLNAEAYAPDGGHDHHHDDGHGHGHAHDHGQHGHRHDINRHDDEIGSFSLTYDEPLHWEHVANWLDALVMAHGDQLLRVKGILNIAGRDRPIVVQAVQRLFHPPFELAAWPDATRRSRIVFITRALPRDFVVEVFDTIRTRKIDAAPDIAADLPAPSHDKSLLETK